MNDLRQDEIEAKLLATPAPIGLPLSIASETESTNDDAKRAARSGIEAGAAFLANTQSRGRGRRGHAWYSPPGDNLYVSFVLRPRLSARDTPPLALAAGLAVVDAVRPLLSGDSLRIKWPNDVLLDGKKLAGILVEAQVVGERAASVVIGIGVNVHTREFPSDLSSLATSLALAGASIRHRGELFVALCHSLSRRVQELVERGVSHTVEELSHLDYLAGKTVTIEGERGTALGIHSDGRFRFRDHGGNERIVSAGQVTLGTR